MKTKNANLNYQLTDVLEMHFSKKQNVIGTIKNILLDRPIKDFNLHALFSFVLEDALVVIREGDFNGIKRLYLLNSSRETHQTYCIHLLHRERELPHGRKFNDSLKSERFAPA